MKWLSFLVVLASPVFAQESGRDTLMFPEQMIEDMLGEEPVGEDVSGQADDLLDLYENPLDLGRATMRELERIPAITPLLAYRILSARERNPFSSVRDLLGIEGMTEDLYKEIIPFVTVRTGVFAKSSAGIRSRLGRDLAESRGFRDGVYAGTKEKMLHRLDAKLAVGAETIVEGRFQTQKDAGEPVSTAFVSGYLRAESPEMTVLVGDMRIETGRRLLLGRLSMSRAVDPAVSRRSFLRGYHSSDEMAFLRGIGWEVRFGQKIAIGGFYSNRPIHGTVSDDGIFSPLSNGGLFRTSSELAKRNASRERASGASLSLNLRDLLTVSAAAYHVRFLHRVDVGGNGLPVLRDLAGASLSAWFSTRTRNASGTAEIAVMRSGGRAGSASFLLEPANTVRIGLAGHVFNPLYHSPLGFRRKPRSEVGLEAWSDLRPGKNWRISLAWMSIGHPDGRSGREFAEETRSWRVATLLKVRSGHEIALEYATRESSAEGRRVNRFGLAESYTTMVRRHHVRGTMVVGSVRDLQWTSRIEYVDIRGGGGKGILLSQQCHWRVSKYLLVEGKLTLFGTASYDARLYAFEPDVPGAFASRAVFGDGTRGALLVRVSPFSRMEVSCSYSVEIRDGQRSLGSGLDEIQGDHRNALSIQADFKL